MSEAPAASNGKSFASTSPTDVPSLLHLSCPPGSNFGAVLVNCDKKAENELFLPGFAIVGRLLPGETVAREAGVVPGDVLVAVNGHGFRRFKPDYKLEDVTVLTTPGSSSTPAVELDHAVVEPGSAYEQMLAKIKALKASGETFTLTLERYTWDARPLSWFRFLQARDNNVMDAMSLIQTHETWKASTFPIPLQTPGLQTIMRTKAVSEIDIEASDGESSLSVPTVYVNYAKLLELQTSGDITGDDVVSAFVIFTERMLAKNPDARAPKTTQFIDLSGVSLSSGFRVDTLKKIYNVFEPNYPETLHKMVMYPVSSVLATTARTMLSFVNERTQKKFLITNDLAAVCKDLGWNQSEIEDCGGMTEFMHKHEKAGTSMIMDDEIAGDSGGASGTSEES